MLIKLYLSWLSAHAKLLSSCPTLCDPVDCSPPGSSVHGILQARILEWVPCPPPGDIPNPGIKTASLRSPALAGGFFTTSAIWEGHLSCEEPGKNPVAFWYGLCDAAFHSSLVTPFKGWWKNYFFIRQHCTHLTLVIIINRGNMLHFYFIRNSTPLSQQIFSILPSSSLRPNGWRVFFLWSFPWTNKSTYRGPQVNCRDLLLKSLIHNFMIIVTGRFFFLWGKCPDALYHFLLTFMPISREGNGTPLQCSCLENPMDGGAWWAAVHGVAKSQTRLNDFTFTFHFPALEKEMATHSSVLAWRIPGTGEPVELPSMGSHRVGHDWSDLAAAAAASPLDLKVMPNLIHSKISLHWKWLRWKYIFVIKLMTYEGKTILWY